MAPIATRAAAPPSAILHCSRQTLYKGDVLTVDLPPDHGGLELAIWTENLETFLITFTPNRRDTIAPVIAPGDFGKMTQVKLATARARGSPSHPWQNTGGPLALGDPEPIFTASGLYEVLLDGDLGYDDAAFAACWIDYFDYPQKASAAHLSDSSGSPHKERALTEPHSAVGVSSLGMTGADKRAFRRATRDQDGLIVDQGEHFHVLLP